MAGTNPTLDLTKIPFGGAHCGILIYEENNSDGTNIKPGLYLGARIQGGEHRREGGIVDIVPVADDKELEYTYSATPTKLTMTCKAGEIQIIIDTDSTARIFAKGVGIKLYAKFPFYSMMNASILPGDLLDLNLGGTTMNGGRYLMKPNKGKPVCYSVFNPSTNGPDDARVELHPDENGDLDFEVYTMNPDEWGYIDYEEPDEACTRVEKNFENAKSSYPEFPEKYAEIRDFAVYAAWLSRELPNTVDFYPTMVQEVFYSGKLTHGWANAYEQPLHAMAFADCEQEYKFIENMFLSMKNGMLPGMISTSKSQYQAGPPTQGLAVMDLLRKSNGKLDKEKAKALYSKMKENYLWWKKSHSFGENRFSYNHRDELCLAGVSYNVCQFPLETPDLYTLMIFYVQALEKLAALSGEAAESWQKECEGLGKTLLELWNGKSFDCRSVRSGERYTSESLLARLPVALGNCLPEDIPELLRRDVRENYLSEAGLISEKRDSALFDPRSEGRGAVTTWLQELFAAGLTVNGEKDLASEIASRVLDNALEGRAASVVASEGSKIVYRPGDAINSVTGSALVFLASVI